MTKYSDVFNLLFSSCTADLFHPTQKKKKKIPLSDDYCAECRQSEGQTVTGCYFQASACNSCPCCIDFGLSEALQKNKEKKLQKWWNKSQQAVAPWHVKLDSTCWKSHCAGLSVWEQESPCKSKEVLLGESRSSRMLKKITRATCSGTRPFAACGTSFCSPDHF